MTVNSLPKMTVVVQRGTKNPMIGNIGSTYKNGIVLKYK
jgi:hypothetical protein